MEARGQKLGTLSHTPTPQDGLEIELILITPT